MQIKPFKTKVFKEKENLFEFIFQNIKKIPKKNLEKSILVITSKIVALTEERTVICKNEKEKINLIKKESTFALKTEKVWLTIKDDMVMANAGMDESNANGKIILLPKDSFQSAEYLRKEIMQKFKLKNFGVLITDSRIFPLRAGIVGVALGYAGFSGVRDYRGTKDIFNRKLKFSRTDVADSLATSAVLCMGEGKERQPLALITEAPVQFLNKVNKKELIIKVKDDLYLPLFQKVLNKKAKK